MKLVNDANNWYRWWSMRWIIATAFFTSVIAAYALLPSDWLPEIPAYVKKGLAIGSMLTAGLAGISRVVSQPKLEKETKQ